MAAAQNIAAAVIEPVEIGLVSMLYAYPFALFDGVTSVSVEVALPRNALVDDYKFLVQARRVDSTKVQAVAQVRSYAGGGLNELVIDFGTPRTVSGIDLPGSANVLQVYPWLGSQFSVVSALGGRSRGPPAPSPSAVFAELRTERLRVLLSRALTSTELADVRLRLPEPPSGLEIRIDDGAPVWAHPEPVQPRADITTPVATAWDGDSQRIVDLTAALAALGGDPLAADDAVVFKITLTTKVPCELDLDVHGTPALRRVRRVRFGSETSVTLDFASEGLIELPLALPAPAPAAGARRIDQIRWFAVADLGLQRVLPPVGPDVAAGSSEAVLAELTVSPDRAVCVGLPASTGLAELTTIRLPLRALGDGAEARLVLWSVAPGAALPLAPLPQGSSEPVTLAASAAEEWVSFVFRQPVPVDAALMPWMALTVARGELTWALARAGSGAAPDANPMTNMIRRGPPNGPWKALPAPLQSAAGVIDARARLRLGGHAPKEAPLAPLGLSVDVRPAVKVTPSAKGVAGELLLSPGLLAPQVTLYVTSLVGGSVLLRDVDVVSNN